MTTSGATDSEENPVFGILDAIGLYNKVDDSIHVNFRFLRKEFGEDKSNLFYRYLHVVLHEWCDAMGIHDEEMADKIPY